MSHEPNQFEARFPVRRSWETIRGGTNFQTVEVCRVGSMIGSEASISRFRKTKRSKWTVEVANISHRRRSFAESQAFYADLHTFIAAIVWPDPEAYT